MPCIARVIKNRVESRALQANSCENLNKGYCKLGQVKGDCSGREGSTAALHPIHRTQRTRPSIHGGTGFCKARFQGAASPCSRWPIASFTLSGFTNPVRLHPCILGLKDTAYRIIVFVKLDDYALFCLIRIKVIFFLNSSSLWKSV